MQFLVPKKKLMKIKLKKKIKEKKRKGKPVWGSPFV